MPVKLVDNVKIYNTTTGTGAIVLGSPVPAYRGVEALTNGQVYSYSIHQGANYEYGRGTYLAAGQQFIRSPIASSTGGTALDLQPNAEVAFVALAEDLDSITLSAEAVDAAAEAQAYAAQTALDAAQTTSDRTAADLSATAASVAATSAQVGASIVGTYANAYTSALPRGVTGTTSLVGGSGGTNGTFALGFSGGSIAGMAGTFTVSGGAVTAITITNTGLGSGTTPPTLSFTASSGLTGASATAVVGPIVAQTKNYYAASADGTALLLYSNDGTSTPAAVLDPNGVQIKVPTNTAFAELAGLRQASAIGRPVGTNPAAGTGNAGAAAYLIAETTTFDRTIYQVRAYNNSGSAKTVNLRRWALSGGNWTPAPGSAAVSVSIPSGGLQTVALPVSILLKAGEELMVDAPVASAFTYTTTASDSGGYRQATTGASTIADATAITTTTRLEFAADYYYDYVTTARMQGVEANTATALAQSMQASSVYSTLKTDGAIGRSRAATLVSGTSVGQFGITFANALPRARLARRIRTYNSTSSASQITLFRASRSGNVISQIGTSTAVVTIPAGPGIVTSSDIPNGFAFSAGDLAGMIIAPNALNFVSATGDEGGYYGLANAASPAYTASGLTTNVQLQVSIEYDELADIPAPTIHVNQSTIDRIALVADSFGAGQFVVPNQAPICRISRMSDWNIENFSLGGSTFRRDDGIAQSRNTAIRVGTARYGTLPFQSIPWAKAIKMLGRNDATLGNTIDQLIADDRELDETLAGMGIEPIVASSHSDHYGTTNAHIYKTMAEQQSRRLIDVREKAQRLGQDKGLTYADARWAAGHPGVRNHFHDAAFLQLFDAIEPPRLAHKVLRPRAGVAYSTIADLYYAESPRNYRRNLLWEEIQVGHTALKPGFEKYWDDLTNAAVGSNYQDFASEYLTLLGGGTISCTDFVLNEFTLDHLPRNVSRVMFSMTDVGATIYVPNNVAASPTNGTAPGTTPTGLWSSAISPTVANGIATYTIPDATVRAAMRGAKLVIAVSKSGSFTLGSVDLTYVPVGPRKPAPHLRDMRKRARGTELLATTGFPTTGSPTGWTTGGAPTTFTPADPIPNQAGAIRLASGDSVAQAFTYSAPLKENRTLRVTVVARAYVQAFSSGGTYPSGSLVTPDTLNQALVVAGITSAAGKANRSLPVGMGWFELTFDTIAQMGTTGETITIAPDTVTIEVAEVGVAFVDA